MSRSSIIIDVTSNHKSQSLYKLINVNAILIVFTLKLMVKLYTR